MYIYRLPNEKFSVKFISLKLKRISLSFKYFPRYPEASPWDSP